MKRTDAISPIQDFPARHVDYAVARRIAMAVVYRAIKDALWQFETPLMAKEMGIKHQKEAIAWLKSAECAEWLEWIDLDRKTVLAYVRKNKPKPGEKCHVTQNKRYTTYSERGNDGQNT